MYYFETKTEKKFKPFGFLAWSGSEWENILLIDTFSVLES